MTSDACGVLTRQERAALVADRRKDAATLHGKLMTGGEGDHTLALAREILAPVGIVIP